MLVFLKVPKERAALANLKQCFACTIISGAFPKLTVIIMKLRLCSPVFALFDSLPCYL